MIFPKIYAIKKPKKNDISVGQIIISGGCNPFGEIVYITSGCVIGLINS